MPTTMIANVAANPIANDTRPPSAVRMKRSRPNPSVPNGCSQLGDWYACEKSIAYGSSLESHGTKITKASRSRKATAATTDARFFMKR